MQLPRYPAALGLLGIENRVERFTRRAFGEMNRKRGASGERLREAKVVVGEARIGTVLVKGGNDADALLLKDERDHERP